jgi:hypothetical protein
MFGTGFGIMAALLQCPCGQKLLEYFYNFVYLWGGRH